MSKRYAGGIVTATFKPLDPHGDLTTLFIVGGEGQGAMGLNLGGTVYRSSPVQIGTSTDWYRGYSAGPSIRAGAIKQNGTMWVWGNSENGQLGLNGIAVVSSPTQVGALTTWSQMTVKQNTSLALKTDGSLWMWGASNWGQLGQNNLTYRSSPVQVGSTPAAATSWSEVAKSDGQNFTAIIDTSGRLWTMGYNNYGMLGQNDTLKKSSPVQVGTDTNWSLVATGDYHVLARKSTGAL
jgi:alpha-tubulin suppressor-like RCC1 family protein